MQWDPADLTRFRSDRDAAEFVVDGPISSDLPVHSSRRAAFLIAATILILLAVSGSVAVVVAGSANPAPAAAPAAAPVQLAPPPPPASTPAASPGVTRPPSTPPTAIASVDRILAITYPSRVSDLTAQDEKRILELVREPLSPGQRVLVSGFAGYDWATKEGAQAMSRARASTIQQLLARHGVPATVIAYGDTPADSVLGAAMADAVPVGDTENLLAFVSIAVLEPQPPVAKQ